MPANDILSEFRQHFDNHRILFVTLKSLVLTVLTAYFH